MAEAVAPDRARIRVARELLELGRLVFDEAGVEVVVGLLVELDLGDRAVRRRRGRFRSSSAARCVDAISSASIPVSAST